MAPRRTSLFPVAGTTIHHTSKYPVILTSLTKFCVEYTKADAFAAVFTSLSLVASTVFVSQGPLKQASKFAEQLSGAVNQKVMELGDSAPSPDIEAASLEGAEAAAAATAAAAGGAAGIGMAQGWKPPTTELGMDEELANDVPGELSIDEQVGFLQRHGRRRSTRFPK